jgi:hypothetical protein
LIRAHPLTPFLTQFITHFLDQQRIHC